MKNFLKRLLEVILIPLLAFIYWCIAFISLAITIAIAPAVYLFTGVELIDKWIGTAHFIEDKFLEKIYNL